MWWAPLSFFSFAQCISLFRCLSWTWLLALERLQLISCPKLEQSWYSPQELTVYKNLASFNSKEKLLNWTLKLRDIHHILYTYCTNLFMLHRLLKEAPSLAFQSREKKIFNRTNRWLSSAGDKVSADHLSDLSNHFKGHSQG